jgi:hypothetical protein
MYDDSGTVNGNGAGGVTQSSHYWKHGIYRGSPNVTTSATIVHLDGMTRAKTFEDAAFGAFGDIPSSTMITTPTDSSTSAEDTNDEDSVSSATTTLVSMLVVFVAAVSSM